MFNPPRTHIYRAVKTPCYGCTDRHIGCHGSCPRVLDYRAELGREKDAAWEANAMHHKVSEYKIAAGKRYKR